MASLIELWETLKHAITTYTGLSPAAFFTAVAVAAALYHLVASFLAPPPMPRRSFQPEEEREPLPPPVQLGEITEEELKEYDGSDEKKPLLMAIKGQIYDVTQSRMFYGPGGPYALFAGRDASRALAKMSFEQADLTSDISGLGPFELDALQDWEYKFMTKYTKVGTVKKPAADDASPSTAEVSKGAPAEVTARSAELGESVPAEVSEKEEKEEKEEGGGEVAKEE
ncbi:hypothetical protein LUZ60_014786 [Juncus effusus]|nr:hypothetical protein LUZ60_014786 [Juncus effusus]